MDEEISQPIKATAEAIGADIVQARQRLDEMCRKLLANPVIEDYTCEVVESDERRRAR